jgi:hypothetical protein
MLASMRDPSSARAGARPLAVAPEVRVWAGRWGMVRTLLNTLSALAAVLFLMSAADLDTPVPYLCGAAVLLAALGAELAV